MLRASNGELIKLLIILFYFPGDDFRVSTVCSELPERKLQRTSEIFLWRDVAQPKDDSRKTRHGEKNENRFSEIEGRKRGWLLMKFYFYIPIEKREVNSDLAICLSVCSYVNLRNCWMEFTETFTQSLYHNAIVYLLFYIAFKMTFGFHNTKHGLCQ